MSVEITERPFLPEGHELVGAVEERDQGCGTGPEQGSVGAHLKPDAHITELPLLGGLDPHIALPSRRVDAVEQQLAAKSPGDRRVAGKVEGHPHRIRVRRFVRQLHRDPKGKLLGDEEAHHHFCLNRLTHHTYPALAESGQD